MAKFFNDKVYMWPDVKFDDRHWIIYIQIYDKNRPIAIKKEWFDIAMPAGLTAHYGVISWKEESEPEKGKTDTIIRVPKQGKINVFQQAISEVEHKYKKQKEKHDESKTPPMLLRIFDDYDPSYFENMKEDFYVQRKYNGTRTMAELKNGKVHLYSRKLHVYSAPEVEEALIPYMKKGILIDGELYIHKTPLQIISGIVRGSDLEAKKKLVFVIFDLINLHHKDMIFSERMAEVESIFKGAKKPLIIAPTYKLGKSQPINEFIKKLDHYYKEFLAEDYEGAIIRRDLAYESSFHNRASDRIFKHKPLRTDEFKVIGFEEGKGKDAGLVVWRCKTKNGREFTVRPKQSNEDRRKIYKELKNDDNAFRRKYQNKDLTVQFMDLSIDGIPQQPRAIIFRDYE